MQDSNQTHYIGKIMVTSHLLSGVHKLYGLKLTIKESVFCATAWPITIQEETINVNDIYV